MKIPFLRLFVRTEYPQKVAWHPWPSVAIRGHPCSNHSTRNRQSMPASIIKRETEDLKFIPLPTNPLPAPEGVTTFATALSVRFGTRRREVETLEWRLQPLSRNHQTTHGKHEISRINYSRAQSSEPFVEVAHPWPLNLRLRPQMGFAHAADLRE